VAGALTERDFVEKLEQARFENVEVLDRTVMSIDDIALYPLFTQDLLALMRTLIPEERQRAVATSVVVRAVRG
jgi:arsenite methyltransferase